MRLSLPLLFALMLSACGGESPSASAPVVPEPVLESAVESAPTTLNVGDAVLAADVYFVPQAAEGDFDTHAPAGPSLGRSQRAGGVVLITASGVAADIRDIDIRRVVSVTGDNSVEFAPDAFLMSPLGGVTNRVALFLPEGLDADYLAIEISAPAGQQAWLGAHLHPGRKVYRTYTQGQFTGESSGAPYQPVLHAQIDSSSASASIATVLQKFGMAVSEAAAMEGMLRFGEADKIVERRGFSLLDMKLYLAALGLDSAGYLLADLDSELASLVTGASQAIIPVNLFGIRHFVIEAGLDDQYLYLASPLFGNVAVPRSEVDTIWPPVDERGRIIFVLLPPADESEPTP